MRKHAIVVSSPTHSLLVVDTHPALLKTIKRLAHGDVSDAMSVPFWPDTCCFSVFDHEP